MTTLDPRYAYAKNDPALYELVRFSDTLLDNSEIKIAPVLMEGYKYQDTRKSNKPLLYGFMVLALVALAYLTN